MPPVNSTSNGQCLRKWKPFRMMIIFCLVCLSASLTPLGSAEAQDRPDAKRIDTARTQHTLIDSRFFFDMPHTLLPLSAELSNDPDRLSSLLSDPAAGSTDFFTRREQEKPDLAAPWKLQLARQERYSTMQAIVGAVQAGGTAYLAYRYLKKHGFK
ncbi:MAG TPA: hypothetical protein VK470_04045 [Bacteroidota bacterium]|nr:hypothetical protein [Bacteroidota bacterium]